VSPRTGRPKIDNPKGVQITARVDSETLKMLDKAAEHYKETRADTIRRGIKTVYKGIKTKK
jgi:uncharacterized protein (DUF1778 family)